MENSNENEFFDLEYVASYEEVTPFQYLSPDSEVGQQTRRQSEDRSIENVEASSVVTNVVRYAAPRKRRPTRKNVFNFDEKKMLILQVKQQRCIWDISGKLHANTGAVNSAWKVISTAVGKPISNCKSTWVSLRESKRYRRRKLNRKSGDGGGEPLETPEFDDALKPEVELMQLIEFLPDNSRKRRITEYPSSCNAADVEATITSNNSVYSYDCTPAPKKHKPTSVDLMSESIKKYVDYQCSQGSKPQAPLTHYSTFVTLDNLLNKLSPEEADRASDDKFTLQQDI